MPMDDERKLSIGTKMNNVINIRSRTRDAMRRDGDDGRRRVLMISDELKLVSPQQQIGLFASYYDVAADVVQNMNYCGGGDCALRIVFNSHTKQDE